MVDRGLHARSSTGLLSGTRSLFTVCCGEMRRGQAIHQAWASIIGCMLTWEVGIACLSLDAHGWGRKRQRVTLRKKLVTRKSSTSSPDTADST